MIATNVSRRNNEHHRLMSSRRVVKPHLWSSILAVFWAVLIFVLIMTPSSQAGNRDHADGLLLRVSAGGGVAKSAISTSGFGGSGDFEMDGTATNANVAIGVIVSPNLAIHGTAWGWYIGDPEGSVVGVSRTIMGHWAMLAGGVGATYYVMPTNICLSASIGVGSLHVDVFSLEGWTKKGLVFDAAIGKEWWMSGGWGLGMSLGAGIHSIPEVNYSENWTGHSIALRLSATMN